MKRKEGSSINKIIIAAIVLIALFLIGLNVYSFLQIRSLSNELNISAAKLEERQQKLAELTKIEQKKEDLTAAFETLKKKIPLAPTENQVINTVEEYAEANRADLINLQIGKYKEDGELIQIPLNMSFKGRFSDLVKFLSTLENSERLIRIDGINLTKEADSKIRADIIALTYYKKAK